MSLHHGVTTSLCQDLRRHPSITASLCHKVTTSLSGRQPVTVSRRHGIAVGPHGAPVSQRHFVTVGTSECHGVSDVTASEYHGVTVSLCQDDVMASC